MTRNQGRGLDQLRELKVTFNPYGYADASVLIEQGLTKVLCSVTLNDQLPPHLRNQKTGSGWLSAEYAMLPSATQVRSTREAVTQKRNSRSIEISRLIGRSFRSVINLNLIGERTIQIDCEVLQADGGTRVAAISGTNLALRLAQARWLQVGLIKESVIKQDVAAISVALVQEQVLLDPDFAEDSTATVDFNFVLTRDSKIIEIQGTAETAPVSWEQFEQFKKLAQIGTQEIFNFLECEYQKLWQPGFPEFPHYMQIQLSKKKRQHVPD